MKWPDVITCHGDVTHNGMFKLGQPVWREPKTYSEPPEPEITSPYEETWRTCSFCGSIHPEDIFKLLTGPSPEPNEECLRCYADNLPEPTFVDQNNPTDDEIKDWKNWSRHRYSTHSCKISLHGADWKYGWPHKFYVVGIPNPIAGKLVPCSGSSAPVLDHNGIFRGQYNRTRTFSPAPSFQRAKWYNDHLLDEGFDDEAFSKFVDELEKASRIQFRLVTQDNKRRIKYSAPSWGYQEY